MTSGEEKIIRNRLNGLSGKEFQQKLWDILCCYYSDFQCVKKQNDLGSDGHSIKEKIFFAVYAIEPGSKYDNSQTIKKISNPNPLKKEELGDYEKFLKNWKDTNNFNTWVFVTKDSLMGRPHKKLSELNSNGDGIVKINWCIDNIIAACSKLDNKDIKRIFELDNLNLDSKPEEVETIMNLICYISENAELLESSELNDMPDPDKKLKRFANYCNQIKKEIVDGAVMYAVALQEAENAIGSDKISTGKKVLYLKAMSRRFLRENNDDPMVSLDKMTDFFNEEISKSGRKYDHSAIRYYLISEIPKCNVFPNENE